MTRILWCQSAVENKAGIPPCDATGKFAQSWYTGVRCHREVCAKPVYRRTTPQRSLHKAGIPASDILGVKKRMIININKQETQLNIGSWNLEDNSNSMMGAIQVEANLQEQLSDYLKF